MIFSGKRQRWKPLKIIVAKEEVMIEMVTEWYCGNCGTRKDYREADCPVCDAADENTKLVTQINQLRTVIEQVEFIGRNRRDSCGDYEYFNECPWCDGEDEHFADCPRQAALEASRGTTNLS